MDPYTVNKLEAARSHFDQAIWRAKVAAGSALASLICAGVNLETSGSVQKGAVAGTFIGGYYTLWHGIFGAQELSFARSDLNAALGMNQPAESLPVANQAALPS